MTVEDAKQLGYDPNLAKRQLAELEEESTQELNVIGAFEEHVDEHRRRQISLERSAAELRVRLEQDGVIEEELPHV
jgi:hypothetical protein